MQSMQAARAVSGFNLGVLKEPRGFIKVLQFVLAIFAFACATSNNTSGRFTVYSCGESFSYKDISYPYNIQEIKITIGGNCISSKNTSITLNPYGDWSSGGEFYVFVGVMAFLNCIGVLVLYIIFDDTYQSKEIVPLIDFIVAVVFVALWLIGSSVFAASVSNIKYYSKPSHLYPDADRWLVCGEKFDKCKEEATGNWATLDVSILFGFLNMIVWGGSLWFLWKETKWHKEREESAQAGVSASSTAGTPDKPQI